jgi:Uma2 family endonuclease
MSLVPGRDATPSPVSGVKLTYDDFVLFPNDGKRHELINGEHHVTPSPNRKHQAIVWNLTGMLWSYLRAHPIGRAFSAPFDVVFSDLDVVEPDLLYVSNARKDDVLTAQHVRGAPDLVVEVGSPGTRQRDEKSKHRLYERHGVVEYWVVDSEFDFLRVYRLADGQYLLSQELSLLAGDVLTTPLLPGLSMPLELIFED